MTDEMMATPTRTCAKCNEQVSEGQSFCPNCGTAMPRPAAGAQPEGIAHAMNTPGSAVVPSVTPVASLSGQALLPRARKNDRTAIETMFKQFLPPGEEIIAAEYLGIFGFWGFGRNCFGVVTDRRIASLLIGSFEEVHYQDASLEYVNSAILAQPSKSGLYLRVAILAVLTLGIGLLFTPIIARGYYRRKKAGLVLIVREGVSVYVFIDRKRMLAANRFYREVARLREERIRLVGAI